MAKVELTRHLHTFFPDLEGREFEIGASTVAEVVSELDRIVPGLGFYICDERGRLRQHVNIFVDQEMIADRRQLTDKVTDGSRVFIAQALSGG